MPDRREPNANRSALQPLPPDGFKLDSSLAKPLRALLPVYFYFLAAGIATVMLGPLLPSLIQRWHIQDAQAGTLFTANFAGQFCGAWFATRNLRASIVYGSAITAAGCIALAWVGFGPAHIALFCTGLGLGAGLTAGNVIAGTAVPAARARLLAILNVVWGFGAIACPVLVRLSSAAGIQYFFFATAALLSITAFVAIAIPSSTPNPTLPAEQFATSSPASRAPSTKQRLPLPPVPLFVFGAAIFLYIGIENALGGWLPSYAVRTNPAIHAPSIALYFWIAELTGRILVTVLLTRVGEEYFAYPPLCPHQEEPLRKGLCDGELITCFKHIWQWDVRTGACAGTESRIPLKMYPARKAAGQIEVFIEQPLVYDYDA